MWLHFTIQREQKNKSSVLFLNSKSATCTLNENIGCNFNFN